MTISRREMAALGKNVPVLLPGSLGDPALRTRTPGARALLPVTRCRASGQLGALLSSPVLGVRLLTALQVLQVLKVPARVSVEWWCDVWMWHLEHLECSHQPHIQGRGAQKRTQRTWSTWGAVISLTSRAGELINTTDKARPAP